MLALLLLSFLCSSQSASASTASPAPKLMSLNGKVLDIDSQPLANVELSLSAGTMYAVTTVDGSFSFYDVPSGIYLIDVLDVRYHFSQMKVKVDANSEQVSVLDYKYPGASKQAGQYPLLFKAHTPLKYFEEREKLGLHTIMNSGMVFTVLVPLAMVFLLPKMMQSVDKEEMKEMQQKMAQNNPQQMFSQMFGGQANTEEEE